jgi:membrane-associated phospholipid phosphatase
MPKTIFVELSKKQISRYFIGELLFMGIFIIVYGSCNYYASSLPAESLYRVYFEFEKNTPFIPASILVYRSLDLLLFLALFLIHHQYYKSYFKTMITTVFIAAFFFIMFPGKIGYVWPKEVDQFKLLYDILYSIDKPHNLAPSLHITYTFITLEVMKYSIGKNTIVNFISHIWMIGMSLSVLFTHQHHLLDIVTGFMLGFAAMRLFHYFESKKLT